MHIRGPVNGIAKDCERVLRTLPLWFGQEASLLEYANNTDRFPTFIAEDQGQVVAFLSLHLHFQHAYEIDCIAVEAKLRNRGVGRLLHQCAQDWLLNQGAKTLQVKTLADSHPSPEYALTRKFYEAIGYQPLEVFHQLWGAGLPVLQLIKVLEAA